MIQQPNSDVAAHARRFLRQADPMVPLLMDSEWYYRTLRDDHCTHERAMAKCEEEQQASDARIGVIITSGEDLAKRLEEAHHDSLPLLTFLNLLRSDEIAAKQMWPGVRASLQRVAIKPSCSTQPVGNPPDLQPDIDPLLSHAQLVTHFKLQEKEEAARKRLERLRKEDDKCYVTIDESARQTRDAKYLYRLSRVTSSMLDLVEAS